MQPLAFFLQLKLRAHQIPHQFLIFSLGFSIGLSAIGWNRPYQSNPICWSKYPYICYVYFILQPDLTLRKPTLNRTEGKSTSGSESNQIIYMHIIWISLKFLRKIRKLHFKKVSMNDTSHWRDEVFLYGFWTQIGFFIQTTDGRAFVSATSALSLILEDFPSSSIYGSATTT